MNSESQYQQILQSTAEKLVRDCYNVQALKCGYVVQVQIIPDYDITILAGYPPTIIVSSMFLNSALFEEDEAKRKKQIKRVRSLISRAVSYLPRQERSLAIQPLAEILAVKEGMRRFGKSNHPDKIIFRLPDSHIKIESTYTVTATEITTGQSVTLTGHNESILRTKAVAQLTELVARSEYLASVLESEKPLPNPKPVAIHFKESEIKNEY